MTYYKRGRTVLADDFLEEVLKAIDNKVMQLPPEKRDDVARKVLKDFKDGISDVIDKMKDAILLESRKDVKEAIRYDRDLRKGFERRLYRSHRDIIESYTEMLGVCLEAVQSHREITHKNIGEKDTVLPVILRLHARIHRMANEILALVRAGYGAGALSRWRSMHETAVVMAYLIDKGPKAIKIMQDHQAVSDYKAMKDYQTYSSKLGEIPFSPYEVMLAKRKYDRRIAKYNSYKNFKKDYGWVSVLTPSVTNFRDLEKYVGIDHLRPYYKLSSLGVHMEWKSLLIGEEFQALNDDGIVLVGPADYGFEDAVSLSLLTAAHATTMILTYNLSMKSLMYAKLIKDIQDRAQEQLAKVTAKKNKKA